MADDILLGEEYENMTTADAKVRALPGSAVTVEIVQAPSKDVLAKLEQHTRYGCTAWIPFYALQSIIDNPQYRIMRSQGGKRPRGADFIAFWLA